MDPVDIHSHFLPGVDDGPSTLEESIAVLRAAHASGVRRMVATPHMFLEPWNHRDRGPIEDFFASTVEALQRRAAQDPSCAFLGELTLDLGAENFSSPELIAALERDRALTLNGSRYLLVEFPVLLPVRTIVAFVQRIRETGRHPVIAHVERYAAFHQQPKELERLAEEGVVLQVNAHSLSSSRNDAQRRRCLDLLVRGVARVVASDVHGPSIGRPHLGTIVSGLRDEVGSEALAAWISDHPRRLVDDQPMPAAAAATRRSVRGKP